MSRHLFFCMKLSLCTVGPVFRLARSAQRRCRFAKRISEVIEGVIFFLSLLNVLCDRNMLLLLLDTTGLPPRGGNINQGINDLTSEWLYDELHVL